MKGSDIMYHREEGIQFAVYISVSFFAHILPGLHSPYVPEQPIRGWWRSVGSNQIYIFILFTTSRLPVWSRVAWCGSLHPVSFVVNNLHSVALSVLQLARTDPICQRIESPA